MQITSDAKTPQDFQKEVVDLIRHRAHNKQIHVTSAKTIKERETARAIVFALDELADWIGRIEFPNENEESR